MTAIRACFSLSARAFVLMSWRFDELGIALIFHGALNLAGAGSVKMPVVSPVRGVLAIVPPKGGRGRCNGKPFPCSFRR
jgi:hypothetical protein